MVKWWLVRTTPPTVGQMYMQEGFRCFFYKRNSECVTAIELLSSRGIGLNGQNGSSPVSYSSLSPLKVNPHNGLSLRDHD